MNVISLSFLGFLAAVLLVYYLLPGRPQNIWLLIASYAFHITWAWQFALVLLILTIGNFGIARIVGRVEKGRRVWLWAGIGLNVAALAFLRLAAFFVPEAAELLTRLGFTDPTGLQLLLPIGLSYYILENISYQVDVYRGQVSVDGDFLDFALYLAYFPKLLAGPIERARSFLPKLAQRRLVDNDVLARSFTLVIVGLVRKLIIADTLNAAIPWDVFVEPSYFGAIELFGWLVVYAFALYNDFAGYTSLVRGVSGFFGIEMSANFKQPYFARNFTEFWNRWHITLSHWLRDYIYFPISRSLLRRNPSPRNVPNLILPPITTMLVSGLWHGFSANMLVWGGMHGVYQVMERLPSLWRPVTPPQRWPRWRQLLGVGLVFFFTLLAWVPFRMELPVAVDFWRGLTHITNFAFRYRRIVLTVPLLLLALAIDWFEYRSQDETVYLRWPRLAQATLLAVAIFFILIISQADYEEPFVYQGF
jgi:alginate O-acetyltransferase complex protein AlgI